MEKKNNDNKDPLWYIEAIVWGVLMFVILELLIPWVTGEPIIGKQLLFSLPFWIFCGFLYVFLVPVIERFFARFKKESPK